MTEPVRPYDALLLDLDGTLVADDGHIRPRVLERLRALHADGVTVMVATGRSEGGTKDVLAELGFETPAIVFNGAGIWCPVEERLVEERLLADEAVTDLLAWTTAHDLLPVVVGASSKHAITPRTEFEERALAYFHDLEVVDPGELPTEYVIRVTVFSATHETSTELRERIDAELRRPVYITDFPLSWLAEHRDSPLLVADVQPPCRGKGEGLRFLRERFDIDPTRVVAIGDATNDVPMFQDAGLAVAMGNGMPEALAAADRVIGDNNSDTLVDLFDELFA